MPSSGCIPFIACEFVCLNSLYLLAHQADVYINYNDTYITMIYIYYMQSTISVYDRQPHHQMASLVLLLYVLLFISIFTAVENVSLVTELFTGALF